jgi:hypothetical protein
LLVTQIEKWCGNRTLRGVNAKWLVVAAKTARLVLLDLTIIPSKTIPEKVTTFTDAQTAIGRMASEEPPVRDPGAEAHRGTTEAQTRYHRDPVVPRSQRGYREWECR